MILQTQRPLGIVLALALTAAMWLPTLSNPLTEAPSRTDKLVYAAASPLVLM